MELKFSKYPTFTKRFDVMRNAMRLLPFIIAFFIITACQSNQANNKFASKSNNQEYANKELGTLSIILPSTWLRIPNDSLPQTPDMTARYWIRTSTGDTVFLVHGFSAWDLSEDSSEDYIRVPDTLFGRKAIRFRSKAENNNIVGVFVDSVGKEKQVGYYGFTAYSRGLQHDTVDSFYNAIKTIRLHPFK